MMSSDDEIDMALDIMDPSVGQIGLGLCPSLYPMLQRLPEELKSIFRTYPSFGVGFIPHPLEKSVF